MSAYGRTEYAGHIDEKFIGKRVTVKGWVSKRRDLGNLIFIDVRDRMGIVQCVFLGEKNTETHELASTIRNEFVVSIEGEVVARSENTVNDKIPSGKVEIIADKLEILSKAKTLPFVLDDASLSSEELRLKYRYLDLRRTELAEVLQLRSKITKATRDYLDNNMFVDVETPILTKSTPEGAHPGEFYALPQSPQLFKQLLMVAGFDRYYQVARCFRDEDLRADRQPDFTQIDMEMSFMSQEEILTMIEGLIAHVMKEVKGIDVVLPFPRLDYEEAMERFGSDKPDTRFDMELKDVSDLVKNLDFKVFSNAVEQGGAVKCIVAKGCADKYSRKDIDALGKYVANYGAKGLAWVKVTEEGLNGAIAKFFTDEVAQELVTRVDAEVGDIILFAADTKKVCYASLGALRQKLAADLGPDKEMPEIFEVSGLTKTGLQGLLARTSELLAQTPEFLLYDEDELADETAYYGFEEEEKPFKVSRDDDGGWRLSGDKIERLFIMTNFDHDESVMKFARQMRAMGVDETLRSMGAKDGDYVRIQKFEFEFVD